MPVRTSQNSIPINPVVFIGVGDLHAPLINIINVIKHDLELNGFTYIIETNLFVSEKCHVYMLDNGSIVRSNALAYDEHIEHGFNELIGFLTRYHLIRSSWRNGTADQQGDSSHIDITDQYEF